MDYISEKLTKQSAIKDSGNRTEFESGAVRDMREGKGRFDVAPLEVAAWMLGHPDEEPSLTLTCLSKFLLDNDTRHLYDALYCFKEELDVDTPTMLLEVAKHYEDGAKKYAPDNWRKSIPVWCYIDSATRHYIKWRRGDNDEPHSRAFVWNIMCCIWEVDYGDNWREVKGYSNKA